MSDQENTNPVVPPGVQHVPGSEGSEYVSPNTTKGTPKKDQSAVEESRKKDEVTPDPQREE